MIEGDSLSEEHGDAVAGALRLLARRERALRESQRSASMAASAAYEGMSPEDCSLAVSAKRTDAQLPFADMTRLEWHS